MPPERPRRSSILKPPKARNPLSDLDLKLTTGDDDGTTFDRNKRVSFANTQGIALFRTTDNVDTIWDNFLEETNKINMSESSDGSHSKLRQTSVAENSSANDNDFEYLKRQVIKDESSQNEENCNPQNCFNTTFSLHAMDTDEIDEDHCVIVSAKESSESKSEKNIISDLLFDSGNPCTIDKTEELINFKVGNNSSECSFNKLIKNENKESQNINIQSNLNKSDGVNTSLNCIADDVEMSITQCISTSIEVNNVSVKPASPIKNECNISFDIPLPKSDYINDKENLVPIYNSNYHDDQENSVEHTNDESNGLIQTFDQATPNSDMSITAIVPDINDFEKKNHQSSNIHKSIGEEIILAVANKRRTQIFDQAAPISDMSMTAIIYDTHNKIGKENKIPSDNSKFTSEEEMLAIPNRRQTQIFDQATPISDMSMTAVIPDTRNIIDKENKLPNDFPKQFCENKTMLAIPNKRQTLIFDQATPISDMSMTAIIPDTHNIPDKENKQPSEFPEHLGEDEIMLAVPNRRRIQIFDQATPISDMSMTAIIPDTHNIPEKENKQPSEFPGHIGEDEIMLAVPNRRRTQIFDQATPISDMSMTAIISDTCNIIDKENKQPSDIYKHINEDEIMLAIPSKRRTQIFDQATPISDMLMTAIIPDTHNIPDKENKEPSDIPKQIGEDEIMLAIPSKRRTQIFDQATPISDMSMTAIIPDTHNIPDKENKQHSEFPEHFGEDEIMLAVPNRRRTQIFDQATPISDMSMTAIISDTHNIIDKENIIPSDNSKFTSEKEMLAISSKRRTQIFDQATPISDMSMTAIIPDTHNIPDKENKQPSEFPEHLGEDEIMLAVPNKRRTQIFDQATPISDMSMTAIIPDAHNIPYEEKKQPSDVPEHLGENEIILANPNKRQTLIFNQAAPISDMSMTAFIPDTLNLIDKENKQLSDIPKHVSEDEIMLTIPNKRRTEIFDQATPNSNMSMTAIIPDAHNIPDKENKKTSDIPKHINEDEIMLANPNKRRTQIFEQVTPITNMSMTAIIPDTHNIPDKENKEPSDIPKQIAEDEIILAIPSKRRTQIFDQATPISDMSMTAIIPDTHDIPDKENKQHSEFPEHFGEDEIMLAIPNRRRTQIFDQVTPISDMSMTAIISDTHNIIDKENKIPSDNSKFTSEKEMLLAISSRRRTQIFDQATPISDMSMTAIIPDTHNIPDKENKQPSEFPEHLGEDEIMLAVPNKRRTQIFDQATPISDMSMTAIIPDAHNIPDKENKQPSDVPEHLGENEIILGKPNKRQTLIFNQAAPISDMSMTALIPDTLNLIDKENKQLSDIPKHVSEDEIMLAIPNKRRTQIFDQATPISNMSMTAIISDAHNITDKEDKLPSDFPEHLSDNKILLTNSNKRQTQIFDQTTPMNDKSMTAMIPDTLNIIDNENKLPNNFPKQFSENEIMLAIPNKRQPQIFDQATPISDMSMTAIISDICDTIDKKNKNPSDHSKSSSEEDMLAVPNKRKTLIFNRTTPIKDLSTTTNIANNDDIIKKKDNQTSNICKFVGDETILVIPNKMQTQIFDQAVSINNMTMTAIISDTHDMMDKENKPPNDFPKHVSEKEIITTIPVKRQIHIFNHDTSTGDISMAPIILDIDDLIDKEKVSMHYSKSSSEDEIISVIPNKRLTQIFNQDTRSSDMPMTATISNNHDIVETKDSPSSHISACFPKNDSFSPQISYTPMDIDISVTSKSTIEMNSSKSESKFYLVNNESVKKTMAIESITNQSDQLQNRLTDSLINNHQIETSGSKILSRKRDTSRSEIINQNVSLNFDASPCRKKQKNSSEICTWLKSREQSQSILEMEVDMDYNDLQSPAMNKYIDESSGQQKLLDNISDISLVNTSIDAKVELQENQIPVVENHEVIGEEWIKTVFDEISVMNLSPNDCIKEEILLDEWNFLLLDKSMRLRIGFEENYPIMSTRPITHLSLEYLPDAEKNSDEDLIHMCKALKNQLEIDFLLSVFSVWGDVPELLEYCAKISSTARKWGQSLKILYVKYGLKRTKDLFSLKLWNGYVQCIWNIEIETKNLPFAHPEDIKIKLNKGNSDITSEDFISIIDEIDLNWEYMKNLLDNLYAFINALKN